MLMASGANFGVRRTVPHMLGIGIGFVMMVMLVVKILVVTQTVLMLVAAVVAATVIGIAGVVAVIGAGLAWWLIGPRDPIQTVFDMQDERMIEAEPAASTGVDSADAPRQLSSDRC